MATPTLQYPDEILGFLGQEADELEKEGRLLLALKYYENGQLSSGLAAQLAGVSRTECIYILGKHGLSSFGETPEDLEKSLGNARKKFRRTYAVKASSC